MIFTTKEELILQAKKDDACKAGIIFAASCKDLQEIIDTIDDEMILWCIRHGYYQFADHCDWGKLDGFDWSLLLRDQPQFADHCDWLKLSGEDWSLLLSDKPKLADHCDWSKLDG